jgi:hypothetical protein
MSLEEQLGRLATAIEANTKALEKAISTPAPAAEQSETKPAKDDSTEEKKTSKKSSKKKSKKTAETKPASDKPSKERTEAEAAVLALVQTVHPDNELKGKELALKCMKKVAGVASLKEVPEDKLEELTQLLNKQQKKLAKEIEELEADEDEDDDDLDDEDEDEDDDDDE